MALGCAICSIAVGSEVSPDQKPAAAPATLCMTLYLEGIATVDELYMPTKGVAGLSLRTFDAGKHQWSIYWVSSATGRLDPVAVVGGFEGNHGEFYAADHDGGRAIKVRYTWDIRDHEHARWEQAFSYDDRTWETNWTADFERADPARTCAGGRPRRQGFPSAAIFARMRACCTATVPGSPAPGASTLPLPAPANAAR
jgi:hypothetical protein